MINQISTFQFQSSYDVRIQLINNDPYFCLKDVCDILDIPRSSDLVQVTKGFVKNDTLKSRGGLDEKGVEKIYLPTNGGKQEITFISEPNLYRVIFRSNKPEAKQFQDWVFNDVLPTIRKTGSYSVIDKSNYITNKQLNDLKMIVNNISTAYFYEDSFTQGIWKMMRDITGADSVQHITKDKFYLLKPQIEKMLAVTQMYFDLRKDTDVAIVKEIFRGHANEDVVIFNVKHKHAQFIANLNKNHMVKLDNFSKKLLTNIN